MSLDALHIQAETLRQIVHEQGGDSLLTVKGSQPALQAVTARQMPDPGSPFLTR